MAHLSITRTSHCIIQILPLVTQKGDVAMYFRLLTRTGSKKLHFCKNGTTGVMFFVNSQILVLKNIAFF